MRLYLQKALALFAASSSSIAIAHRYTFEVAHYLISAKPGNITKISFLNSKLLMGNLISLISHSGVGYWRKPWSLDDCLEVSKHFRPHGLSNNKVKAGTTSERLVVNELVNVLHNCARAFFPGTGLCIGENGLKEVDFDVLLDVNNMETVPDELLAMLDDTCDLVAP